MSAKIKAHSGAELLSWACTRRRKRAHYFAYVQPRASVRTVKKAQVSAGALLHANTRHAKKAQVSAEALLVFLVFITALGISYAASGRIGAAAQERMDTALSKEAFFALSAKISQACAMGEGNIRTVEVRGPKMSLSFGGGALHATAGKFSQSVAFPCSISIGSNEPSNSFRVENTGTGIEISQP